MYISAETEIRRAVVRQDRAIECHLAANRHIGITVQHLVAQQIEWILRSRHVGADHVKWRELQPVQDLASHRLRRIRQQTDQAAGQTNQFGGVRAFQKLRSLMYGSEQLPWLANIQWNRDRDQRDAIRLDFRCHADLPESSCETAVP